MVEALTGKETLMTVRTLLSRLFGAALVQLGLVL
jgi:hypothetical protein